jgi:hypothetical protein
MRTICLVCALAVMAPPPGSPAGPQPSPSPPRLETPPAGITAAPVAAGPFIGNKGSKKVHRADCIWGQKTSPGKKKEFATYAEAVKAGYVPCRTCRPDLPEPPTPKPGKEG